LIWKEFLPMLTPSTVSQRGVVFFRGQKDLDNELQKELCQKLGLLTGKPAESSMHIHPISNKSFQCNKDDEISVISNDLATKIFCDRKAEQHKKKQSLKKGWHSDITFEPVPSDYAILKLTDLPTLGGGKLLLGSPSLSRLT
jgi:alpha-ketoglutarate-dependent taurine dioxygenase